MLSDFNTGFKHAWLAMKFCQYVRQGRRKGEGDGPLIAAGV